MKYLVYLIIIITFFNCNSKTNNNKREMHDFTFYVGTYTNGESEGIYKYDLKKNGQLIKIGLAAKSVNPSYIAFTADKKYLIAVNEINEENQGTVESFKVKPDSLKYINTSKSGGAHPCFVSLNKEGYILTANYTGGNVGLLRLNQKGELSPLLDLQQHTGSGTTKRQNAPHAHSVWFSPNDSNVISVDLGTNQLWFSHLDTILQKLVPSNPNTLNMKTGAGPRHLVFHPNEKWIYVVNELDCTITLVQKSDKNQFQMSFSISTLPLGYSEPNTCADIKVSSDGKYIYASNRGHNSIAIYHVNSDGSLKLLGHESTRGDSPRNFSLSPDNNYLLVANQKSNNIVSFKRDKLTGLLEFVGQIGAPTPVCIKF